MNEQFRNQGPQILDVEAARTTAEAAREAAESNV